MKKIMTTEHLTRSKCPPRTVPAQRTLDYWEPVLSGVFLVFILRLTRTIFFRLLERLPPFFRRRQLMANAGAQLAKSIKTAS